MSEALPLRLMSKPLRNLITFAIKILSINKNYLVGNFTIFILISNHMFCTCGGGLAIAFVQIAMQIYEKKSKVSKRKSSFCFAMIKKCANFAKLTKKGL